MEGSDLNTRRMIACELLKGIMGNYKDKISAKAGGAFVSTDLVDVDSFFRTFIVPELQGQDVNAFPMLKVGNKALEPRLQLRKQSWPELREIMVPNNRKRFTKLRLRMTDVYINEGFDDETEDVERVAGYLGGV
nr:hypothetical protein [Tanacetum cinerariifolium]